MQFSSIDVLVAARKVADHAMNDGVYSSTIGQRTVYWHMGALIADAALQAGLNYSSVVKPRINRILALSPETTTTSEVYGLVVKGLTGKYLDWQHPEKVRRFEDIVSCLWKAGIETADQLKSSLSENNIQSRLSEVKGVGPKTIDYICCLVGLDAVAVDRHIRTYAARAGIEDEDYDFLNLTFCYAADLLNMPRRDFDSWVWQRESTKQLSFAV